MPKMVTIEPNPDFSPKATEKKDFDAVKKVGAKLVPYQTALQNVKASGGMYRIKPEAAAGPTVAAPKLAEMGLQDLKVMMVSLGIKTDKQMTKSQVIQMIEKKLAEIDLVDDDETA